MTTTVAMVTSKQRNGPLGSEYLPIDHIYRVDQTPQVLDGFFQE